MNTFNQNLEIKDKDTAVKSYFLGPNAENKNLVSSELDKIFNHWFDWRKSLFNSDGKVITEDEQNNPWNIQAKEKLISSIDSLIERYRSETPKFTPRYIGHMVSDISIPSILGHILNLLHNPNLASNEVARTGSEIEQEAISDLRKMIGFNDAIDTSLEKCGHFTSGGTLANFEAMWRARYRLDHWLSLGAYLNLEKNEELSVFGASHMGWDSYHHYLKKHKVNPEEHKKYSFVANSPWEVAQYYNEAFGHTFKGSVILVPGTKHYSWQKGLSLMGFGDSSFWSVELDDQGRLSVVDLENKIGIAIKENRPILMVVSVTGTTELGEVDPVDKVNTLLNTYKSQGVEIWHHVDAAYGGFYCSLLENERNLLSNSTFDAFDHIKYTDSVTIDPHKLGYTPYACGAILLKNELNNRVSSFKAPYLIKSSTNNSWTTTLEGSRSASGAAACWMTSKAIGLNPEGMGSILQKGLIAKHKLVEKLEKIPNLYVSHPCDTNIIGLVIANEGESTSSVSQRSIQIYNLFEKSPNFAVSKTHLSCKDYSAFIGNYCNKWNGIIDSESLCLIRIVLMNPFVITSEANVNYLNEFSKELENYI
jgi:glutamate/tyrosine decarboxylase-like PLP-dependent enzyme